MGHEGNNFDIEDTALISKIFDIVYLPTIPKFEQLRYQVLHPTQFNLCVLRNRIKMTSISQCLRYRVRYSIEWTLISKPKIFDIKALRYQIPISRCETSISKCLQYRGCLSNLDIDFNDFDINAFDVDINVIWTLKCFNIDVKRRYPGW